PELFASRIATATFLAGFPRAGTDADRQGPLARRYVRSAWDCTSLCTNPADKSAYRSTCFVSKDSRSAAQYRAHPVPAAAAAWWPALRRAAILLPAWLAHRCTEFAPRAGQAAKVRTAIAWRGYYA